MHRNSRALHSVMAVGTLAGVCAVAVACSNDQFSGCEAHRTCPESSKGREAGAGGEGGGGTERGGSGGSRTGGHSGAAGAAGDNNGGEGGSETGGSATGGTATGGQSGTEEGGAGGEGGTVEPPDGPTVVSVSPTDGEVGVALYRSLIVTFSRPMDPTSTEAAFRSQDIPPEGVRFGWNGDNTVLTIDPMSDLAYYEVTSPTNVTPNYSVAITDDAEDASGNHLATDFEWSFRTFRRVTHTLPVPRENIFIVYSDGGAGRVCFDPGVFAGDGVTVSTFAFVSIDTSSLPEYLADQVTLEAASLSAPQSAVVGTPFGSSADNLGLLRAYHMNVTPANSVAWTTPNLGEVGVFSASAELSIRTLDVFVPLLTDWPQRNIRDNHSQYKLSFDQQINSNGVQDRVVFPCDGFTLNVRYRMR